MGEKTLITVFANSFLSPVLTHLILQSTHYGRRRCCFLFYLSLCIRLRLLGLLWIVWLWWRSSFSKTWFGQRLSLYLVRLWLLLNLICLLDTDGFPLWNDLSISILDLWLVLRCFIFAIKQGFICVLGEVLFWLFAMLLFMIMVLRLVLCPRILLLQARILMCSVVGWCCIFPLKIWLRKHAIDLVFKIGNAYVVEAVRYWQSMWVRYLVFAELFSRHNEVFRFLILFCTIDRTFWAAACFISLIYSRYDSIVLWILQIVSPSLSGLVCESSKLITRMQFRRTTLISEEFLRILA